MYSIKEGLVFDDVLLTPKHSKIKNRSEIDLSVKINNLTFSHPIIPANMKTIIGKEMLEAIYLNKGLGLMHRFLPVKDQLDTILSIEGEKEDIFNYIGFSIGVQKEDYENLKEIDKVGASIICIDIAHGDSEHCIEMIKHIKKSYPRMTVIAGNIATSSGAINLWKAGADVVKCGVGSGGICLTRINTGNGVPQLTSLMDVFDYHARIEANLGRKLYLISDGGIRNAGDCVKSLCFSDMIMMGGVFAGCEETPGTPINIGDKTYKQYIGSSTYKKNYIEGVSGLVKTKGSFNSILNNMLEGIRSGCSYQGASNLSILKDSPQFVKITNSGLIESKAHDIILQ